MNHWRKQLADYVEQYGPDQAAVYVVNEQQFTDDPEFKEWIIALVRTQAKMLERQRVRYVEKSVFELGNPTSEERKRLANETFVLPTGERVYWLEATVQQHQDRIDFQTSLIGNIELDIDRHTIAIDLIMKAGVTCLADIEAVAV